MPRTARAAAGGIVYHGLNRGNGRASIFRKPEDYAAFLELLVAGKTKADIELFGFCLMSNHWHLVVRPKGDGDLAAYLSWVTNTHVKRYRAHHRGTSGHLYRGRYKSFPVEEDACFLTLLRYVEANPRRAGMVKQAVDYPWSSLGCGREWSAKLLDPWPVDRPRRWAARVDQPLEKEELQRVTTSLERGRPLGSEPWTRRIATRLGLDYTLRPRGRPPKQASNRRK